MAFNGIGSLSPTYTFATLPTASSYADGTVAFTSDYGYVVVKGGNWYLQTNTILTPRKRRAIFFGDSLGLRNNSASGGTTISSITVISSSEILVSQATHRFGIGSYVSLAWVNNSLLLGRTVRVTALGIPFGASSTVATHWRFANPGIPVGTTISAVSGKTITGVSLNYTKDQGIQAWINLLCGQPFDWVANCTANGATSADILTFLPGALAGPVFEVAFVLTISNDVNSGSITTAQSKANVLLLCSQLLAYGAWVILCTPAPVGAAIPGQPSRTLPLRDYCLELGRTNQGITTFDLHQWAVDYTSATDDWISSYTTDQLHQIQSGAYNIAKGFKADITPDALPPPLALFPQSAAEDPNVNAFGSVGNLTWNPMLTGSGGTVTSGTGTCATNWRVINTSLSTCVCTSGIARTDGKPGLLQQIDATGTGNFLFLATGQTLESRMVAGTWYQYGLELWISGTNITEIQLESSHTQSETATGITNAVTVRGFETAGEAYLTPFSDMLTLFSEPFYLPAGRTIVATYAPSLKVVLAAGSCNAKIGRPFLKPIIGL